MSDLVLVAVIAATPPTLAVLVAAWKQHQQLNDIHMVVNSRLTAALKLIEDLKEELRALRARK